MYPIITDDNFLQLFTSSACVDWAEFAFKTSEPVLYSQIRERLAKYANKNKSTYYVEPLNAPDSDTPTTEFNVRFQNPRTLSYISECFKKIDEKYPLVGEPELVGIEVAFDMKENKKSGAPCSPNKFAKMATAIYWCSHHVSKDNIRYSGDNKGSFPRAVINIPERVEFNILNGSTICIGNHARNKKTRTSIVENKDPYAQRIYYKTTDKGGKKLAKHEHSARFEITLQKTETVFPPELPLYEGGKFINADGSAFRFESLSKFFRLRKREEKDQKSEFDMYLQPCGNRGASDDRRVYKEGTKAFREMNDKIRYALRHLTERFKNDAMQKNGLEK
jgi:hypothetical protein